MNLLDKFRPLKFVESGDASQLEAPFSQGDRRRAMVGGDSLAWQTVRHEWIIEKGFDEKLARSEPIASNAFQHSLKC